MIYNSMRIFNKNPIRLLPQDWTLPKDKCDIEIGAGVGWHAIEYCKANPHKTLFAIEKTSLKFNKFNNRLAHHSNIRNLFPVHANAIDWISQFIGPNQVENYFILYPNLYPKHSQANKRWHNSPFMSYLLNTLTDDGRIILSTNNYKYFNEAKEMFANCWHLTVSVAVIPRDASPRSHFEKKYLERGETCYNIVATINR